MRSNRRTPDGGAVLVEFALIAPLLIILVMGIIGFGLAYNQQLTMQSAVREGARALALGESAPNAEAIAREKGPSGTTASSRDCPSTPDSDDFASVSLTKNVQIGIPFLFERDITLSATSEMRCGL